MMNCSANQKASVKLIVDSVDDKMIPLVLINFSHPTLQGFQNHVMAVCRLHPGEPQYDCETIHVGDRAVDEDLLKIIVANITRDLLARGAAKTPKIKLIVRGRLPIAPPPGRTDTNMLKKAAIPIYRKTPTKAPRPVSDSRPLSVNTAFKTSEFQGPVPVTITTSAVVTIPVVTTSSAVTTATSQAAITASTVPAITTSPTSSATAVAVAASAVIIPKIPSSPTAAVATAAVTIPTSPIKVTIPSSPVMMITPRAPMPTSPMAAMASTVMSMSSTLMSMLFNNDAEGSNTEEILDKPLVEKIADIAEAPRPTPVIKERTLTPLKRKASRILEPTDLKILGVTQQFARGVEARGGEPKVLGVTEGERDDGSDSPQLLVEGIEGAEGTGEGSVMTSVKVASATAVASEEVPSAAIVTAVASTVEVPRSVKVLSNRFQPTVPRGSSYRMNTIASVLKRKASDKTAMAEGVRDLGYNAESSLMSELSDIAETNGEKSERRERSRPVSERVDRSEKSDKSDKSDKTNKSTRPESEKYMIKGLGLVELTPVKRRPSERNTMVQNVEDTEMYKGGVTAAEAKMQFVLSLRSPDSAAKSCRLTLKGRKAPLNTDSPGGKSYEGRTGKARRGGGGGGGGMGGGGGSWLSDFPAGEGRPSMSTITSQWEFMRSAFVNNNEEELEWLMVSKRNGAYRHAHKKNEASEDRYFKALHDIGQYERQLKDVVSEAGQLNRILDSMVEEHVILSVDPDNKESLQNVADAQIQLSSFLEKEKQKKNGQKELKAPIKKILTSLSLNLQRVAAAKIANNIVGKEIITKEVKEARGLLIEANKASDNALKGMEKWSKREKETDDYQQVIGEEEAQWLEKEGAANVTALALMRSYVPQTIGDMSIKDLRLAAREKGGLLTAELSTELKANKLLQWVVMHPTDIAFENFLIGEKKQFFENLERLDVTELRSLVSVVPLRFELDGDGRKMDWRERLMGRAKQVIAQQMGESVKGGWDSAKGCRAMVKLQSLKSELVRRPVYFYPTVDQCETKLKQIDTRQALLSKKEDLLVKATAEALSCKSEYDTLLTEMRDPDVRAFFGTDKVAGAKDSAKRDWTAAESYRKTLSEEVLRLQKSIAESPMTREQYTESMEEIRSHLLIGGHVWGGEEVEIMSRPASTSSSSTSSSSSVPSAAGAADPASTSSSTITTPITSTTATPVKSSSTSSSSSSSSSCASGTSGKGQLFLVEGVFESNPTIGRFTRQAAKFVTAEEEAEGRRQEISALKNRNNSLNFGLSLVREQGEGSVGIVGGGGSADGVSTTESRDDADLINGNINKSNGNTPARSSSEEESSTPTRKNSSLLIVSDESLTQNNTQNNTPTKYLLSPPRNSVLSSVNPDLISSLNRMFSPKGVPLSACSSPLGPHKPYTAHTPHTLSAVGPHLLTPGNRSPLRIRINSMNNLSLGTLGAGDENINPEYNSPNRGPGGPGGMGAGQRGSLFEKPPTPLGSSSGGAGGFKGSRSRILQKLQAQKEEMELLQNRAGQDGGNNDGSGGSDNCTVGGVVGGDSSMPPPLPRPEVKMTFLDELKANARGKMPVGNVSFLDQIKARKQLIGGLELDS